MSTSPTPTPTPTTPEYINLNGVIDGVPAPSAELNNGLHIPLLGLGTWGAEGPQAQSEVETAVRLGYRHIDCAAVYANQCEVGRGLKTILEEGVVPREELFVTSKLWNNAHELVEDAFKLTLAELQLDYLDLYLIHWPVTGTTGASVEPPLSETWQALEGLVDKGLVRSIGVSNFSIVKLKALLETSRIRPAVNQVEAHPYFRNEALLQFCKEQGIHFSAYASLGSPVMATESQQQPHLALEDAKVLEVANRLGKTPAQVLIRWGLQRGYSVIAKSVTPEHLRTNLAVLDWELPEEDFQALSSLPTQARVVAGLNFLNPDGPYKSLKELWDEDE